MECKVQIFTDGSCLGNPGSGGWAAIIKNYTENSIEISGGYRLTTNNRMEITAVIEGLKIINCQCNIEIYSDSQYVCNAIEKKWIDSWIQKNWINSSKKPVKNRDLWEQLIPFLRRHHITMHWLRGHNNHPENERCDLLARTAASRRNLPEDPWANAGNSF